jgi:hypothetical protein
MYATKKCVISNINHDTVLVTGKCIVTGEEYRVEAKRQSFFEYLDGALIQDAFNYLNADDREFLLSGYSPEGWNQIFGKEDEYE